MDGPTIFQESGKVIYRASALGQCTKALVALRLGYEPLKVPDATQKIFDAGREHEEIALKLLAEEGWKLYDQQATVELALTNKLIVRGHIDAKGYYQDRGYVVEIKSQSQLEWDRFTRDGWTGGWFPKYRWQTSVYILTTHLELALVRINRETGELAVSFTEKPFYSLDDIRVRMLGIEGWAARGELPTDCTKDYPCPVFYLHDDEEFELADEQVEQLAVEYKRALSQEKAAKGMKDAARKALQEAAGETLKLKTAGGYRITFFMKKNRPSYNFPDELLPELEKYKTVTESLSMRITEPKADNDEGRSSQLD